MQLMDEAGLGVNILFHFLCSFSLLFTFSQFSISFLYKFILHVFVFIFNLLLCRFL